VLPSYTNLRAIALTYFSNHINNRRTFTRSNAVYCI
jgi:hypothetical protein